MTIDRRIELLTKYCIFSTERDGEGICVTLEPVTCKDAKYFGATFSEAIDLAIIGALGNLESDLRKDKEEFDDYKNAHEKKITEISKTLEKLGRSQTKCL